MTDSEFINKFRIYLIKLFKIYEKKDNCYDFYYFKNFNLIDEKCENKEKCNKENNYNKEFMEILINNNFKNIDMEDLDFKDIKYEKNKNQIIINCVLNFIGNDEIFNIKKYYKLNITFIYEYKETIYIKFNKMEIIYKYENIENKKENEDNDDSLIEEEIKKENNDINKILINLASLDVSGLSKKDQENHRRFMELFDRREKAMSKMKGLIPDEKTINELMQIEIQMRPLAKQERKALLGGVARELGYTGEDCAVITDTLEGIFDCTGSDGLGGLGDLMDGAEVQPGVSIETHVIGL